MSAAQPANKLSLQDQTRRGGRSLDAIWDNPNFDMTETVVLLWLGSRRNFNGDFLELKQSSLEAIAVKCKCSVRTVRRTIARLAERGYIERHARLGRLGQQSSLYALTSKVFEEYSEIMKLSPVDPEPESARTPCPPPPDKVAAVIPSHAVPSLTPPAKQQTPINKPPPPTYHPRHIRMVGGGVSDWKDSKLKEAVAKLNEDSGMGLDLKQLRYALDGFKTPEDVLRAIPLFDAEMRASAKARAQIKINAAGFFVGRVKRGYYED